MRRILVAGFKGKSNSAKIILDKCSDELEKLYLENDFSVCALQIQSAVEIGYDFILMLGQKPVIKSVYIEVAGKSSSDSFKTTFDYMGLVDWLRASGYKIHVSENAGNYLCNHAYFHGLSAAFSSCKKTKIIFLHIPYLKNIVDTDHMACVLSTFLLNLDFHS